MLRKAAKARIYYTTLMYKFVPWLDVNFITCGPWTQLPTTFTARNIHNFCNDDVANFLTCHLLAVINSRSECLRRCNLGQFRVLTT